MGQMVEYPSNGSTASGYLAAPEGGGPGVIVIQEWWGLVPHIKEVCDRFASEGFVALAPDLFGGTTTTEPDEAGKLMMALNLDQAATVLDGAIEYLRGLPACTSEKLGIVGFCMGGGLVLVTAARRPDAFGAVVPFYGVIPWASAQPDLTTIAAPVMGHYAENDGMATPAAVAELEKTLTDAGIEAELIIYPNCDHAFFNDHRPEVYDEQSAGHAWGRTVTFFRTHL